MSSVGFRIHGGIGEVEAAMACWNKISPASPYLVAVRFGVNKGPVIVSVTRSAGSLWILAIDVSFRGICWMVSRVATPASSFNVFCGKIWFPQPSG
jgi:hypothetical protein